MAITSNIYNDFITKGFEGEILLNSDTFKVMLVNGYEFDPEHTQLADFASFEINETSVYDEGGTEIPDISWSYESLNNRWLFTAENVVYTIPEDETLGPVTGAIIYDVTATDSPPCVYIDFGQEDTYDGGSVFQIVLEQNGILGLVKTA